MPQQIIYIINPIAGTRTKKDLQQFIEKQQKKKIFLSIYFPLLPVVIILFFNPLIREEKITDVVIAGGDGTVSQVVNSLMKEDVNFGIIPCGSGNGLGSGCKNSQTTRQSVGYYF